MLTTSNITCMHAFQIYSLLIEMCWWGWGNKCWRKLTSIRDNGVSNASGNGRENGTDRKALENRFQIWQMPWNLVCHWISTFFIKQKNHMIFYLWMAILFSNLFTFDEQREILFLTKCISCILEIRMFIKHLVFIQASNIERNLKKMSIDSSNNLQTEYSGID